MLNELFTFSKGVKQGDGSLFISALHYAIKDVDQWETILTKTRQICTYANVIKLYQDNDW